MVRNSVDLFELLVKFKLVGIDAAGTQWLILVVQWVVKVMARGRAGFVLVVGVVG